MTESNKARRAIDIIILTVIGVVLGIGLSNMTGSSSQTSKLIDQPAPQFALPGFGDERSGTKHHEGKVLILDFWATWCTPCVKQMPALQKIKEDPELKDSVHILSINTDDPTPDRETKVSRFLKHHELTLDVLFDDGTASKLYNVGAIPTLVVIDPSGTVRYGDSGVLSESKLRKLIKEAKGKS
jgi:thiol-disulfide isomerase/thioredoxin